MATQIFFLFTPKILGKISNLTSIFCQMGWFNHQLAWEFLWCLDFREILRHSPPIWACYGGSVQPSKNPETPSDPVAGLKKHRALFCFRFKIPGGKYLSLVFLTSTWGDKLQVEVEHLVGKLAWSIQFLWLQPYSGCFFLFPTQTYVREMAWFQKFRR